MMDLIDREEALKAVSWDSEAYYAINNVPSAEKTGEWKPFDLTYGRNIYFCTACNNASEVPTSMGKPVYKFCPWCGASMVNEDG